jgi:two-component system phosphate regulon sensor histidine kinase PhoR
MSPIQVICLTALACYLLLLLLIRQHLWRKDVRSFALFLLTMLVWQVGITGAAFSSSPEAALVWYRIVIGLGSSFGLFYAQFTRDFLGIHEHPGVIRTGYAVGAFIALWTAMGGPYVIDAMYKSPESALWLPSFGVLTYPIGLYLYGFLLYGFVNLASRFRSSISLIERSQLRYLLLGLVILFAGSVVNYSPKLKAYPIDIIANVVNALMIAYAILRYQLFDITLVVRKGILYSIPTAILGASYFLIVYFGVNLFHLVLGYQVFLLSLVLAAITAVAVQPLWSRLQAGLDRLFFREQYDAGLMIQRLTRTAVSVLDLDSITHMILNEIGTTLHIERTGLFLRLEESGTFRLAAQRGMGANAAMELRGDHPLVKWLSGHQTILSRSQVEALPQFKAMWIQERMDLNRVQAELLVPLLVRGELIGVLVLGPKRSEIPYSQDELQTLTTLANQTAVAVQNAWLFSLEQRKAEESNALLDIAEAVSSTLKLTRLLEIISRRTADVCDVDRCSILLLDEGGTQLIPLMSQFGHGVKDSALWRTFKEQTYIDAIDRIPLIQRVLREQRPLVLDDALMSLVPARWTAPFDIKSLLAVPLISKDRVIGLMVLDHTQEGRRFSEEQVNLATTIGTQATIAIENARLYEETIREKERTETIVEQAFAGIMVVDPAQRILTVNPEVEAMSGYSAQELVGRQLEDLFGPEPWTDGALLSAAMASGQRMAPREASLVGKDGSRDILLGATPIRDGYLLNFADVTRLKEVDRLKSSIVANVSHELRAPLAAIKAYTELLLDNLEGDDRAVRHRFLTIIDQETDWLTELINGLLDLSRLESERYVARMDRLSVVEIVEGVLMLLQVQIRKKDVQINLDLPSDLPPVTGDKELMTILIKNLISNAVKFSYEGGQVDVTLRAGGDELTVDVVDRGIGIPDEDQPLLFTKFYRSRQAREAGIRGTGLGLVLAKEAVETHAGRISVQSDCGVGTRITVTLPLSAKAADAVAESRESN